MFINQADDGGRDRVFLRYDVHGMWLSGRLRCGQLEVVARCDETHLSPATSSTFAEGVLSFPTKDGDLKPYECEIHNPSVGCPPSTISIQLLRLYQPSVQKRPQGFHSLDRPTEVVSFQGELHGKIFLLDHRNGSRFLKGKLSTLSLTAAENKKWNIGNCPVQISRVESFGRKGGSNSQSC